MNIIVNNSEFKIPPIRIPEFLAILVGRIFDIPAKLLKIDLPINSDRMRKLATQTDFSSEKIRNEGYTQNYTI